MNSTKPPDRQGQIVFVFMDMSSQTFLFFYATFQPTPSALPSALGQAAEAENLGERY